MNPLHRPKVEISMTKVVAGSAAAASAALLASMLGVAGTVIGAAIMSSLITVLAALYDHSIQRAKSRVKQVRTVVVAGPLARAAQGRDEAHEGHGDTAEDAAADSGETGHADSTADADRDDAAEHRDDELRDDDNSRTVVIGSVFGSDHDSVRTVVIGPPISASTAVSQSAGHAPPPGSEDTRTTLEMDTVFVPPLDHDIWDEEAVAPPPPYPYRWGRIAVTALLLFALAMGAITMFELITGRPLSSLFTGDQNSGTTIGRIVHHRGGAATSVAPPTSGATATPTSQPPTKKPKPTPTATVTVTSSPTPTVKPSPTPTTSGSPAPSTSATG